MEWYYENNAQPVGPVPQSEFDNLVRQGAIKPATRVWHSALTDWKPFSELFPAAPPVGDSSVPTAGVCDVCAKSFPADDLVNVGGVAVCAACKPMKLQSLREGKAISGRGLWRSGKTLMLEIGTELPERCVKCNGVANLQRLKRRLYWHNPAVYLAILVNLIVYAIIAVLVRKKADTAVSLCAEHASARKRDILIGVIGAPLAFIASIFGYTSDWPALGIIGTVLFLVALIYSLFRARVVSAQKIDEKYVTLTGVCPAMLADFPEWRG